MCRPSVGTYRFGNLACWPARFPIVLRRRFFFAAHGRAAGFHGSDSVGVDRARRMARVRPLPQCGGQVVHGQLHHRPARGLAGTADMRRQHDVVQGEQFRAHRGLTFEHVQPGRGQATAGQGIGERQLIHDAATGDVDQGGGRLHLRQRGSIDDVMRGGVVRQHQHEVINLCQQRIQVHILRADLGLGGLGQPRAVVVQHAHAEAVSTAAGDALADAAHAEDAQRAAVDVRTEHGLERPLAPVAIPQPALGFGDATRGGHQQREAEIGRGFGQDIRGVAGQDAGGAERVDIQVVVAHPDVGDRAQLGRVGDFRRTDAFIEGDQRAIDASQLLGQPLRRIAGDIAGHGQVEMLPELFDDIVEQGLADPDLGARVSHRSCRGCAG